MEAAYKRRIHTHCLPPQTNTDRKFVAGSRPLQRNVILNWVVLLDVLFHDRPGTQIKHHVSGFCRCTKMFPLPLRPKSSLAKQIIYLHDLSVRKSPKHQIFHPFCVKKIGIFWYISEGKKSLSVVLCNQGGIIFETYFCWVMLWGVMLL